MQGLVRRISVLSAGQLKCLMTGSKKKPYITCTESFTIPTMTNAERHVKAALPRHTPTQERSVQSLDNKRRFMVQFANGDERVIVVPESWRVTFGPLSPGNGQFANEKMGWTLRFYETKDKQRACFNGVRQFWDMSVTIIEPTRQVVWNGEDEEDTSEAQVNDIPF